jgi:diguanylate cyclase (GGDEF)-like protein
MVDLPTMKPLVDFSVFGWGRVWAGTLAGTLVCIAAALVIDSYSWETSDWKLGERYRNNFLIPLVVAPPFFFFLLSKLRQLAMAHRELMVVAATDALTNCLNRHAFVTLVERYLDRISTYERGHQGSLLIIDVDHFKRINDTFGHGRGDEALTSVAGAIKGAVREYDVVGRIGGEEFSVLLPGATLEKATTIAERIRREVFDTELLMDGQSQRVSVSVGGVTFDGSAFTNEIFRIADLRLYAAKRRGRNRVVMDGTPDKPLQQVS